MIEPETIREELIKTIQEKRQKNKTPIDEHEVVVIISILGALTLGLISGTLSESSYTSLMSGFFGYTFGRIFNGWQGKE